MSPVDADAEMDKEAIKKVNELDKWQSRHEIECEARHKAIGLRIEGLVERMKRGEILLWAIMLVTVLGIGNHPNGVVGFIREAITQVSQR